VCGHLSTLPLSEIEIINQNQIGIETFKKTLLKFAHKKRNGGKKIISILLVKLVVVTSRLAHATKKRVS
jgi:ribosome biogenesis SPOUT family RNA methylase Rps3